PECPALSGIRIVSIGGETLATQLAHPRGERTVRQHVCRDGGPSRVAVLRKEQESPPPMWKTCGIPAPRPLSTRARRECTILQQAFRQTTDMGCAHTNISRTLYRLS